MQDSYQELLDRLREAATLASVAQLLGWDQETMMPPRAAAHRAEQLALVARLTHERVTDPRVGELLAQCESHGSGDEAVAANLREIRRDYDRACKLPSDLVAEMQSVSSLAVEAWKEARGKSDFAAFRPWLERQIELNRRKAACLGAATGGEAYDALLDEYEPGMTASAVERLFGPLRDELTPLIAEIAGARRRPSASPHEVEAPLEAQHRFNRRVLEAIGFDVAAGRLDVSTHPFSTGIGPGDTRVTTRYKPVQFADSLGSTMHEAGHGMYEQGLPKAEHWGEPLAEAVGLGIHESQSRLWENQVGRSHAFWRWAAPVAREELGPAVAAFSADELYGAANLVAPNLIRVESDEATYNLHILLRFDLERAMLRGDLATADLPAAWNDRMRDDLGLVVPNDADGCMQDIHWAAGSIGYFPTYTLGNLYAALLWESIETAIPDLDGRIEAGEFAMLLDWLRRHVHRLGRRRSSEDLCRDATGRSPDHAPLMRHLRGKLAPLYGLA